MTMLSDGQVQYNQSIAPVDADAGYFETALTDNTLLAAASTVYQWEESSLNRRFADIWQQTEVGEWQFLQRLEYQEGSHASFAKQVYLSNDSAVVMSLRLEDGGFPNGFDNQVYEPDYHIYTRQSDGRWRFKKLVHHTSGFAMNCADCDFYSDIRWPVQLFGKYLFLPVRTEAGLHYQVHDTSTESVGVIASSIPGDTIVDDSINSVSEQGSDDDGVEQTQSSGVDQISNDEQSQAADESDADVTVGTEVDGGSTSGGGGFGLLLLGVAVFGGLRRVAGTRSGVRYLH
jgi:hypothetical protein